MIQQTKAGDLVNFVYAEFNNADFQEHGLKFLESSGLQSKVCHILSVSVGLPLLSSFNPSPDPFGWCCDLCWKFKTLMRNILTLVLGTYSRSLAVEPLVYPNLDWGWEIHFGFARLSPDCFPIFWVQCRFWLVTVKIMICFRIIWYEHSVHP